LGRLGWQGSRWYAEPYICAGYPHQGSAGVMFGYRFAPSRDQIFEVERV